MKPGSLRIYAILYLAFLYAPILLLPVFAAAILGGLGNSLGAVVGALLIAAALLAMATSPEAWDCVRDLAASWFGLAVLFGWTWAFAYHLLNGIRHLVQDAGFGFSIPAFVRNGWLSVIGSLLLTGAIWGAVAAKGGWL